MAAVISAVFSSKGVQMREIFALNRLRCRLGCGLGLALGTMY